MQNQIPNSLQLNDTHMNVNKQRNGVFSVCFFTDVILNWIYIIFLAWVHIISVAIEYLNFGNVKKSFPGGTLSVAFKNPQDA